MLPEFSRLEFRGVGTGKVQFQAVLQNGEPVEPESLSQGTLYALAMLALASDPSPPSIVCIEEIDRGVHPRMLREIRDTLYRLSYPNSFGLKRSPVQVVATTHSPYLLDLFRDHPEEVIIAQKEGQEARFERLADRADLKDLLQEGSLGDMWFSGILGGVPEEGYAEDRE
jgi:predicted ATPase